MLLQLVFCKFAVFVIHYLTNFFITFRVRIIANIVIAPVVIFNLLCMVFFH